MNNKGRITVFLCLLLSTLLILGISIIKITDIRAARAKVAVCAGVSMSSAKALYNNYIFEHYHILLFDKNCGGRGEGCLEELLKASLEENLGAGYVVEDVRGTLYELITDNNCRSLKEQIKEYMLYAGIDCGLEQITNATEGKDGKLDDTIIADMDSALEEDGEASEDGQQAVPSREQDKDPRKFVKGKLSNMLLFYVLPEDETLSEENHNISNTPSFWDNFQLVDFKKSDIDTDFKDIDRLKSDLTYHDSWLDSLSEKGAVLYYARNVFNCLTNKGVNENTVFQYELEYLVAGKSSDKKNITKTVNEIISIRLPVNFAYLIKDVSKTARIKAISIPAALVSPLPEKLIRYLIAGCWAYVESVADVRGLLAGKKLAFFKNAENWITDLSNLGESIYKEQKQDGHGLSYEDYITILLALNLDKTCMRMLDLMELNAQTVDEKFQMESSVTGFGADFIVSYKGYDCSIGLVNGY